MIKLYRNPHPAFPAYYANLIRIWCIFRFILRYYYIVYSINKFDIDYYT